MLHQQSDPAPNVIYQFGNFEFFPRECELRRNGRRVHLQGQPMRILAMLLQRPGELVTREALQRELWPADTFVDFDMGLNTAMRKLRQALGDNTSRPRFIETLSRRGYRLISPLTLAEVREVETPPPADPAAGDTSEEIDWNFWVVPESAAQVIETQPGRKAVVSLDRRMLAVVAGGVLFVLLLFAWVVFFHSDLIHPISAPGKPVPAQQ